MTDETNGTARDQRPSSATAAHGAPTTAGTVILPGATLPYALEGEGRPGLIIGLQNINRRAFSPRFSQRLRWALVETRTGVPTAHPPSGRGYGLDVAVEDVEAVRSQLGWDRVVIVGHSVFALIALEFARAFPQHVAGVVFIGMSPTWVTPQETAQYWEAHASPARRAAHARWQRLLEGPQPDDPRERFVLGMRASTARRWADHDFDEAPLWDGVDANLPLVVALFADVAGYRLWDRPPLEVPVLVAAGRHDYGFPATLWDERARSALPRLTYHLFETAGHTPQLEVADEFDAAFEAWLATLDG